MKELVYLTSITIVGPTEYTSVKICRETPTKAQSVPLSREPHTCDNT